jgi:sigma-B regulation protein RsbU (phosphoserine phosphatase)
VDASHESALRSQLALRRQSLERAVSSVPEASYLNDLLREVDAALSRLDGGTFGLCEICHDTIEGDRLAADPLTRFCLDHLSTSQQRDLEQDLDLAGRIQSALLPSNDLRYEGWQATFHFQPAGPVSGDYCDLMISPDGNLYFMLGDVSGKGIAAAMLMSHLHAMFRVLISVGLPLDQIVGRASRVFCESTHSSQYATLVCGKAGAHGGLEICNAGHLPSLLLGAKHRCLEANGLPLGMFCSEEFSVARVEMQKGERLVLLTDGFTEARNPSGAELGIHPLLEMAKRHSAASPQEFVRRAVARASDFRAGGPVNDDLTLLVIERTA